MGLVGHPQTWAGSGLVEPHFWREIPLGVPGFGLAPPGPTGGDVVKPLALPLPIPNDLYRSGRPSTWGNDVPLSNILPSLRSYEPSWRDRVAVGLLGLGLPETTVDGLIGSRGLGPSGRGTGMGLVDFTPLAVPFAAQEAVEAFEDDDIFGGSLLVAGTLPIPGAKVVSKLPLDEASRMARADALGFRRDLPIRYGSASEDEQVAAAAINTNGKIFSGPSHIAAINRAERELGIPFDHFSEAPIFDGYITTEGRFVTRWEAGDIARTKGQGETGGDFGAKRGLPSEDTAMAVADVRTPATPASEHAKMGEAAVPPASVRFGATEPGLPGGQGLWGSVETQDPQEVASAHAPHTWHRTERPLAKDVLGAPDHEIQQVLRTAWEDGYDSVTLLNYIRPGGKTPETIIVVRDPAQLRSPAAVFDPAKRDSKNLLAGIAGLAVGGGVAAAAIEPRAE